MGMDVDAGARIAGALRGRTELQDAAIERHGVIVLDGARVFERTDPVEVEGGGRWAPGGLGLRGGVRETGVVAGEKALEDALGLRACASLGEAQFGDEPILEGAKEALNAALRLGGAGADPADAELVEGAADLGGGGAAVELLGQREGHARIAVKDAVAIRVGGQRPAIAADELAQEQQVAVRIFLVAEDAAKDATGRIVEGGVQHQARPALFEPGMVTAVHLDEEPRVGHALAPAAMTRRAPGAGTAQTGGAQEPLHAAPRDLKTVAFGEELRQVVVIHARIARAGQGHDARSQGRGEATRRRSSPIAMRKSGQAVLPPACQEAAQVAQREATQVGGGGC